MKDRIRPPKDLEPVLDELKEYGVFQTKQKGMMFAAALGYALNRDPDKHPPPEKYGEGIRLEYFRDSDGYGFIPALAVAATNGLQTLGREHEENRVDLFERYAQTGLKELKRRMENTRVDYLDMLLNLLDEMGGDGKEETSTEKKVRRLEGLV